MNAKDILNKLRLVFELETKFEDISINGITYQVEVLEAGQPISILNEDGTSSIPEDGELVLEDGTQLTITEGIISNLVLPNQKEELTEEVEESKEEEVMEEEKEEVEVIEEDKEMEEKVEEVIEEDKEEELEEDCKCPEGEEDCDCEKMEEVKEEEKEDKYSALFSKIEDIENIVDMLPKMIDKITELEGKLEKFSKEPQITEDITPKSLKSKSEIKKDRLNSILKAEPFNIRDKK